MSSAAPTADTKQNNTGKGVLDKAGQVRVGEELDIDAVNYWLKQTMQGSDYDFSELPNVTQYSGGASNWTYCLAYPKFELILRRAPTGTKAEGAHNMGREYRIQKSLKPHYHYVPTMLACCDDASVIGTEFYVMEKLSGVIPRKNLPRDLKTDEASIRAMCRAVLDCLIELHSVDYEAAGLGHLGKGSGYAQRQIDGWVGRYQKAKTWNVPSGRYVIQWLQNNMPQKERICLIHNDFRFDNAVLNPDDLSEVRGILDWEMATLGDPLMDLGNTLAYWVQADDDVMSQMVRRQPTHLKGMMTRDEVVTYYCDKMNVPKGDFTFYEVYGLFRLAVIVQQIYYRYHHKQTRNPAYKHFWVFVHYLLWRAKRVIKNKS
ncbi:phosphotransferase family protein [Alteromonas sp. a30]|uniref:phosphotransferase family protein n=1 Tax=Alteromonas sp. a30 TaxID=2730917 RepID=UPI00227F5F8F|nr:phosphotransferase family protein [Alteromonas sp. a30]MCY7295585.1 phosphotransferase family protein [Alteromonas sp. a30]